MCQPGRGAEFQHIQQVPRLLQQAGCRRQFLRLMLAGTDPGQGRLDPRQVMANRPHCRQARMPMLEFRRPADAAGLFLFVLPGDAGAAQFPDGAGYRPEPLGVHRFGVHHAMAQQQDGRRDPDLHRRGGLTAVRPAGLPGGQGDCPGEAGYGIQPQGIRTTRQFFQYPGKIIDSGLAPVVRPSFEGTAEQGLQAVKPSVTERLLQFQKRRGNPGQSAVFGGSGSEPAIEPKSAADVPDPLRPAPVQRSELEQHAQQQFIRVSRTVLGDRLFTGAGLRLHPDDLLVKPGKQRLDRCVHFDLPGCNGVQVSAGDPPQQPEGIRCADTLQFFRQDPYPAERGVPPAIIISGLSREPAEQFPAVFPANLRDQAGSDTLWNLPGRSTGRAGPVRTETGRFK